MYSVATWMTPHNSIHDDIEQVSRTGADGIGLWEGKLTDGSDETVREAVAQSGLRASFCMPRLWTILAGPVGGSDSRDPAVRTEIICESVVRLAAFDPVAIVVGPGTSGDPENPAGPLDAVADGLAKIADTAAAYGQRISFELLTGRRGCPLPTLGEIAVFVEQLERDNIGILFDVWHSWADPGVHEQLATYSDRIDCCHVNDVRPVERTWADRVLPGEGRGVAAGLIASLIAADYEGWYELEIVSDDGTYGTDLPDSLWKMPHEELLRRGKHAFDEVYAEASRFVASAP